MATDLAGDTPETALAITLTAQPQTWSDSVSAADSDLFRFTVGETSVFRLSFSVSSDGAHGFLYVGLFLPSGTQLNEGRITWGETNGTFAPHLLAPGTYLLGLSTSGIEISYALDLSTAHVPSDTAGNARELARVISVGSEAQSWGDWVGSEDRDDYFCFRLDQGASVQLAFADLETNNTRTVWLLNSSGATLAASSGDGADVSARLSQVDLAPGPYYVRVSSSSRAGSFNSYDLTLSSTATTATADKPIDRAGNSLAAARQLAVTADVSSWSDWVGPTDRDDYYQFTIAEASTVQLVLSGLSANARLTLLNANGGTRQASDAVGSSDESIHVRGLPAGSYYVRVDAQGAGTTYSLAMSGTATPADAAGNTLPAARQVVLNATTQRFTEWVGSTDTDDYYAFTLGAPADLRLALAGLAANADLYLLNASGGTLRSSVASGTAAESISVDDLPTGNYFVRVRRVSGDTDYELAMSADSGPVIPVDGAGNSLSAARLVSLTATAQQWADWLGAADADDYYRFTLASKANLQLRLSGLTSDADLYLLNASGQVMERSEAGDANPEAITLNDVAAGTYYVHAKRFAGDTAYTLSMAAPTEVIGPADPPPNLGVLSSLLTSANGAAASWQYDAGVHRHVGTLKLGHKDGDATLLVRNATASLTGTQLVINGDFDGLQLVGQQPLFSGQLMLDTATGLGHITQTTGLVRLIGATIDERHLRLEPNALQLTGLVTLPASEYFSFAPIEVPHTMALNSGWMPLSLHIIPNNGEWKFKNGLELDSDGVTLRYDWLADQLSIVGDLSVKPDWKLFGTDASLSITAVEPGLVFRNGSFDAKLELSVQDVRIAKVLQLDEFTLELDTFTDEFSVRVDALYDFSRGKSKAKGAFDRALGLELQIDGTWGDGLVIDGFFLAAQAKPGLPIFSTGFGLTRLGMGVTNISAMLDGAGELHGRGVIGIDALKGLLNLGGQGDWDGVASRMTAEVTGWFGKSEDKALLKLEVDVDMDFDRHIYRLDGEVKVPMEGLRKSLPDWVPKWAQGWLPKEDLFTVQASLAGSGSPLQLEAMTSFTLSSGFGVGTYLTLLDDEDPSNDYFKLWGTASVGKGPVKLQFTLGFQVFFLDGGIQLFGAEGVPIVGSWQATPGMESLLITASWTNPVSSTPKTRVVLYADAAHSRTLATYEEADYESHGIAIVAEWGSATELVVLIDKPALGVWDLLFVDPAPLGSIQYSAITGESAVQLSLVAAQVSGAQVGVDFNVGGALDGSRVTFYADTDSAGQDGRPIGQMAVTNGAQRFEWFTAGEAAGNVWLYAVVESPGKAPQIVYLPSPVALAASAAALPGATPGDDWLMGSLAAERLDGGAGDDVLAGQGGADTLQGGTGYDIAVLPGRADGYRLEHVAGDVSRYVDIHPADGDQGVVLVSGVERVLFAADDSLASAVRQVEADPAPNSILAIDLLTMDWARDVTQPVPIGGLVITRADAAAGRWQFSTDGGTSWRELQTAGLNDAAAPAAGLRVEGGTLLRLLPAQGFVGAAGLSFRTWDESQGEAGVTGAYVPGTAGVGARAMHTSFVVDGLVPINGGAVADTLTGGAAAERLRGLAGADLLCAGAGRDVLEGGDGDDRLIGDVGNDTLDGGAGYDIADYRDAPPIQLDMGSVRASVGADDDVVVGIEAVFGSAWADSLTGLDDPSNAGQAFRGGGGNDTLDGGSGVDTAEYTEPVASYRIARQPGTMNITVTHLAGGADGTDTLHDIEHLMFADRLVVFGPRAEEVARVAFVLWSPAIYQSASLFSKGVGFYNNAVTHSFDTLCLVALQYHPERGAALANKLLASVPALSLSSAQLQQIMLDNGGLESDTGRAAAVKAAALDAGTTAQLELMGVMTQGVTATHNFGGEILFALLPG